MEKVAVTAVICFLVSLFVVGDGYRKTYNRDILFEGYFSSRFAISVLIMFGLTVSLSSCLYVVFCATPVCVKNYIIEFNKVRANEGTMKAIEDVKNKALQRARTQAAQDSVEHLQVVEDGVELSPSSGSPE